jgi:hypothetical protein
MQFEIRNTTFDSQMCHFRYINEPFDSVIKFPDTENKMIFLLSCIDAEIQVLPVRQPPS